MEFQKIVNLLDTTFDDKDLPRSVTKKWIEGYDESGKNYDANKEIRIKTPMLKSDLCDFSYAYIVVEGNIAVAKKTFTANDFEAPHNTAANAAATKTVLAVFQKLMVDQLTMQKIWMSWCQRIICLNTVKITQKQQGVCGIIIEMNQIVAKMGI